MPAYTSTAYTTAALRQWLPPLVYLLSFLTFYFAAMPLLDDPDVPWHLATGELLWSAHHLPQSDPWSFASAGTRWYILSWLWDAMLAMLVHSFGTFGVFIAAVAISAAIMALLASLLLMYDIALPAIALTLLLAGLCLLEFTTARPQLAGYLCVLLFMAVLHDSRGRKNPRALLLLPLLMLLWVNMHGSFLVGFTLLGAYGIEAHFTRRKLWRNQLILCGLACILAALINPYDWNILAGVARSLQSRASSSSIIEWQPFILAKSIGLSAWLAVFVLASNLRSSKAALADKILAFVWLAAMLMAIRHAAIFVLVSAPYLAGCLDSYALPAPPKKTVSLASRLRWPACIGALLLFVAVVASCPHEDKIMYASHSAKDAIDFALMQAPDRRYLADYDLGGQVIYYGGGRLHFMMDSRADTAYGPQAMDAYLAFLNLDPSWQKQLAAYGINGIIVNRSSHFARAYAGGEFHGRWKLVFSGTLANVYLAEGRP